MSNNILNHLRNSFSQISREDPKSYPKRAYENFSDGALWLLRQLSGNIIHLNKGNSTYKTLPSTTSKVAKVFCAIVFVVASPILVPITFVGVLIASLSKSREAVFTAIKAKELINIEEMLNKPKEEKEKNVRYLINEFLANHSSEEIQEFAKNVGIEESKNSKASTILEGANFSLLIEVASKSHISDIFKGALGDQKDKGAKIEQILLLLTGKHRDIDKLNEVFEIINEEDFRTALASLSNENLRKLMWEVPCKFIPILLQDLNTRKPLETEENKLHNELLTDFIGILLLDKKLSLKWQAVLPHMTSEMYEKLLTAKINFPKFFKREIKSHALDVVIAVISQPKLPEGLAQKCKEKICEVKLVEGTLGTPIHIIEAVAKYVPTHPDLHEMLTGFMYEYFRSAKNYMKVFTALFDRSIEEMLTGDAEKLLNDLQYHHARGSVQFKYEDEKLKTTANERKNLIVKFFENADLNRFSAQCILEILDTLAYYKITTQHALIANLKSEKLRECLSEMEKREKGYLDKEFLKDIEDKKKWLIETYQEESTVKKHSIERLIDQLDFVNSKEEAEKIQSMILEMLNKEQYSQICEKPLKYALDYDKDLENDSFLYAFAHEGLSKEKSEMLMSAVVDLVIKYQKKNVGWNKSQDNADRLINLLMKMMAFGKPEQKLQLLELIEKHLADYEFKPILNGLFADSSNTDTLKLLVQQWHPKQIAEYLDVFSSKIEAKHKNPVIQVLKEEGKYDDVLKSFAPHRYSSIFPLLNHEEQMMLLKHFAGNHEEGGGSLHEIFNQNIRNFIDYYGLNKEGAQKGRGELIESLKIVADISKEAFVKSFKAVISGYNYSLSNRDIDKMSEVKKTYEPVINDLFDLISELNQNENCKSAISEILIPEIVNNMMKMNDKISERLASDTEMILALKFHDWEKNSALWQGKALNGFLNAVNGISMKSLSLALIFDYMNETQKRAVTLHQHLEIYARKAEGKNFEYIISRLKTMKSYLDSSAFADWIFKHWDELSQKTSFVDQLIPFMIDIVRTGNLEVLKQLHDKKLDLKFQGGNNGLTLLHYAELFRSKDITDYLINTVGVDESLVTKDSISMRMNNGGKTLVIETPLGADYKKFAEQVFEEIAPYYAKLWLEKKFYVIDTKKGFKLLSKEFNGLSFDGLEDCLKYVKDINTKFNDRTLFHIAMNSISEIPIEILKILVGYGEKGKRLDPHIVDSKNRTPIKIAEQQIKDLEKMESNEKSLANIKAKKEWLSDYKAKYPVVNP